MNVRMTLNNKEVSDLKNFRNFKLLFCGIWLFVGIIFVIVTYFVFKDYKGKEINCTYETTGYVDDIVRRESRDSDGDTSVAYYPVFRYTVDDLIYIKEYNYGDTSSNFHIGEEVNLLLNPNNYDEYLVVGDNSPKIIFFVFGGVGSFCVLVGLLTAIFLKYKPQEEIDEETDEYIKEHTISRDQFETEYKDDGDSPFVK